VTPAETGLARHDAYPAMHDVRRRIPDALSGTVPHPSCRPIAWGGTLVGHRSDAERRLRVGVKLHQSIPATSSLHAGRLPRLCGARPSCELVAEVVAV